MDTCLTNLQLHKVFSVTVLGNQSFDAKAGSIMDMFDFGSNSGYRAKDKLFLNPDSGLQTQNATLEGKAK